MTRQNAIGQPKNAYELRKSGKRVLELLSRTFTAGLAAFLATEDPSDFDTDVPGPAYQRPRSSGTSSAARPVLACQRFGARYLSRCVRQIVVPLTSGDGCAL